MDGGKSFMVSNIFYIKFKLMFKRIRWILVGKQTIKKGFKAD